MSTNRPFLANFLAAFRAPVLDRIVPHAARVEPTPDGLLIHTEAETFLAAHAIVAAGPWLAALVPDLEPLLAITRQTVGWFAPARPAQTGLGRFPIFLIEGPRGFIYGFPDFEGRGVKAARHDHGRGQCPRLVGWHARQRSPQAGSRCQ